MLDWLRVTSFIQVGIEPVYGKKLKQLTSSAWEKWLKRFGDGHRIHHFHMAMIKGRPITYTNLAISFSPCWIRVISHEYSKFISFSVRLKLNFEYSQLTTRIHQGITITESLQPLFSCRACLKDKQSWTDNMVLRTISVRVDKNGSQK